MTCLHCVRGDVENIDMARDYQSKFLDQIASIYVVTFSGGEPSLYPRAIIDFVELCKERNILVANFYIATNAKQASDEFMSAVTMLCDFCGDNMLSKVHISNDRFHENDPKTVDKLKTLPFADFKYSKEEPVWINEGKYAYTYGDGATMKTRGFKIKNERIEDQQIYLNCEGNIIAGCGWSFWSQMEKDKIVCSADSLDYWNDIKKYNAKFQKSLA